jgi:putative flippase GtrA
MQPAEALRLLRFLAVGGLGAALYVGLGVLFADWLNWRGFAASAVAYGLCVVPIYLLQRRVTFQSTTEHATAFSRYAAVQLICLAAGAGMNGLLIDLLRWPPLPAFVAVSALLALGSFTLQRRWAFN